MSGTATTTPATGTANAKPTILLIHGAWHGTWYWEGVRARLAAAGYATAALANPSAGVRGPPVLSHRDDVDAIRAELERVCERGRRDVLVVAHSYGGFVANDAVEGWAKGTARGAARGGDGGGDGDDAGGVREYGVIGVVFVAGIVAAKGENMLQACRTPLPQEATRPSDGLDPSSPLFPEYVDMVDPLNYFYHDVDPAEAAKAATQIAPQAFHVLLTPTQSVSWDHVPITFVTCEHDRTYLPESQKAAIRDNEPNSRFPWTVKNIESAHSPMLNKPDEVVRIIVDAAEKYSAAT